MGLRPRNDKRTKNRHSELVSESGEKNRKCHSEPERVKNPAEKDRC
ncbi:MAG: hypothetical protein K6C94_03695 [Candidatus Gastranaerophilales bacterium]|nr:hypothetical protein [Candidatus Gastranaerophilales bacterium]